MYKINVSKLAPLHIYHKPMWLPSIVRNSPEEFKALNDLEKINQKIDEEIKVIPPKKFIYIFHGIQIIQENL